MIYDRTSPDYINPQMTVNARIGGWLFRRRTVIPLPLALAVLLIPSDRTQSPALVAAGALLVALGEAIRVWAVRQIGAISRTRSERLGPLIASGPFALVRNPLYIGNIALWVGFAFAGNLPWLAPIFVAVLAFEYHAIVRWEERLLEERLGETYRAYAMHVPRWIPHVFNAEERKPRGHSDSSTNLAVPAGPLFSWQQTFYSERGTLIAITVGFVLLWLKAQGSWLKAVF